MKQLDMLNTVFGVIKAGQDISDSETYDTMLQIIAYRINAEIGMPSPSLKYDVWSTVERILDIRLIQTGEVHDWLGEIYRQRVSKVNPTFNVTVADAHDKACKAIDMVDKTLLVKTLFDPNAGTGAFILSVYKEAKDDLIYYGTESDLTAYRTALVNMKLYGVHAKILNTDSQASETHLGSRNWRYANHWTPPKQKFFEKLKKASAAE